MPTPLPHTREPACGARTPLALADLATDAALHARASYRTALALRAIGYALRRSHGEHRDASDGLVYGTRHRCRRVLRRERADAAGARAARAIGRGDGRARPLALARQRRAHGLRLV